VAGKALIMKTLSLILLVASLLAAQSAQPRREIPVIAKAADGVIVSIVMSDKDGHPVAQGSGFLVSRDGRIVTNYHVIKDGGSAVVKLPDGAFYDVEGVLAFDKERDVAVIKARGQDFRTVELGNSDRIQVGDAVVAIGSPLSLESTVSSGIVSGIRNIKEEGGKFLQVTAPISPGSSGGPLFNMAGEVVGITTLYLKGGENLNFAIPINDVKRLALASSKVQDFPNETGVVKVPDDVTFKTPSSVRPTVARAYYMQLYEAGGFFRFVPTTNSDGKSEVLTALDQDYVCFNDDAQSQMFFAFSAEAYDERYAKAGQVFLNAADATAEKQQEAWHLMKSIQQSAPYVDFLDDTTPGLLPPNTQEYFRQGKRALDASFYRKGVKSGGAEYHWDGNSWVVKETSDPGVYIKATKTFRLSIEPTTLRYVEQVTITSTAGTGETAVTESRTEDSNLGSGMCERIPSTQTPQVPVTSGGTVPIPAGATLGAPASAPKPHN